MKLAKAVLRGAAPLALASTMAFVAYAGEEQTAPEPGALLRLEVVMTRSQGDKVVARLPYSMLLNTGGRGTRVYAGIQLPIVVRHEGSNTVMFKNAGSEVRAEATALADGRFRLELSTELGSVYPTNGETAAEETGDTPAAPVLRSFSTNAVVALGDGESTVLSDTADPITGETVETELTLHVVK
jgi:Flp pilus assembly secretin CpaC